MSKRLGALWNLHKELVDAREEIDVARKDLEESEFNYTCTSLGAIKTLLKDDEVLDVRRDRIMVRGNRVATISRNGENVAISLMLSSNDDDYDYYDIDDLTDDELFYVASVVVDYFMEKYMTASNDLDDYEEEEEKKTTVLNLPAVTSNTEITEDVFWSVVKYLDWSSICELYDDPVPVCSDCIDKLGYNNEQRKELVDIYFKLRNELKTSIKTDYSQCDFTKDDSKLDRISDYIISLGDEIYVNIFNGIEDLLLYIGLCPTEWFMNCFTAYESKQ